MTKEEEIQGYWEEAVALVDALLPIPPKVCLDSKGVVMRTNRCLGCPIKTQCELREGG